MSEPRSLPARSTNESFPRSLEVSLSRRTIWQMACDRDEVSFASVAWVVRFLEAFCAYSNVSERY